MLNRESFLHIPAFVYYASAEEYFGSPQLDGDNEKSYGIEFKGIPKDRTTSGEEYFEKLIGIEGGVVRLQPLPPGDPRLESSISRRPEMSIKGRGKENSVAIEINMDAIPRDKKIYVNTRVGVHQIIYPLGPDEKIPPKYWKRVWIYSKYCLRGPWSYLENGLRWSLLWSDEWLDMEATASSRNIDERGLDLASNIDKSVIKSIVNAQKLMDLSMINSFIKQ